VRPLICAHRGASAHLPDNSREAFLAAIEMGADAIETDVRRDSSGRLVLAHDPVPDGTAGELVELVELVELARGRVRLDVELKEAGWEQVALAQLEPRPAGLLVTSFLPEVIATIRGLDPSVRTGLVAGPRHRSRHLFDQADGCGADLVVPHVTLVDDALRQRALH
jgi:glycerophosphoryl diester phosphodiesterase